MSVARLAEHARLWERKPVLRMVYAPWFDALLEEVPPASRVVEVGAGPALFARYARAHRSDLRWAATDLAPATGNDVVADAHALPFRTASVDAIVGLDVLHHLARPRTFFAEAARILSPGGRLALVEPWVTPFSFVVYRFFHQEDCVEPADPWSPFSGPAGSKDLFEGNAAVPRAIVRAASAEEWTRLGLEPPRLDLLGGFAYLLSLGFRPRSLLPVAAAPALLRFDRWSAPLARLLALRARLVWRRRAEGAPR